MCPLVECFVKSLFHWQQDPPKGCLVPVLIQSLYSCELLHELEASRVACCVGGMLVNVLAYADDIVLLAPSVSVISS